LPRLLENVNFPKVITVLACVFGVSLGLCGLTAWLSSMNRLGGSDQMFLGFGMIEMAAMILSAVGLVLMTILWVFASAVNRVSGRSSSDPQKLFDNTDSNETNRSENGENHD
jgi:hypothetical protein